MVGRSVSRHSTALRRRGAMQQRTHLRRFQRRTPGIGFLWSFLVLAGFLLWFGVIAVGGAALFASRAIANYAELLPPPDALIHRDTFETTRVYDRTGTVLLYEIIDPRGGRRTRVTLDKISPYLIQATLAAEDRDFYSNPGFDIRRIVSAAVQNFTSQQIVSGASTITQQLVRNVLFDPDERTEQSISRKIKEAAIAYQITQTFTKDQILEMYVNEISYGNQAYGIEAAAESYFGKSVSDLTLAEAALLAGLPQSPSYYDPYQNLRAAKERQAYVLNRMVEDGYITDEQAKAAAAEELKFANTNFEIKAPHFVFYVRDQLEKKYGRNRLYNEGWNVITTLDMRLQENAERIVKEHVEAIHKLDADNAALVAMDPRTAEILTMVGSVDYYDESISGQVNVATSERQPGSTLKPITYALAFQKGWTPATIIQDVPMAIPDNNQIWRPQNFDNKFRGPVTARNALAQSLNIPAIKALQYVGVDSMIRLARAMGLSSFSEDKYYGLSVTIGGAEVKLVDLVGAYTVFATGGIKRDPVAILKITDQAGNVIEEYHPGEGRRIFSPEIAYLITSILSDNQARLPTYGPGNPLELDRPAAVKTGTTDDNRDSWTVGYTPELVAGVWVGNTDNRPMRGVSGATGAGQVWHNFMMMALEGVPKSTFERPPEIVESRICIDTDCTRSYSEVFIRGTERQGGRFWDSAPSSNTSTNSSPFSATMTAIAVERAATRTPGPSQTATSATATAQAGGQQNPPPAASPKPAQPTPTPAEPPATPTPAAAQRGVVPNVIGMSEEQAKAAIQAAGLRVAPYVNYQGHDQLPDNVLQSVPIGTVLSSSPGPGTQVAPGTVVNLAVRKD